jgi:DNA-directed RNA polymerase specialized sigma24 family protein
VTEQLTESELIKAATVIAKGIGSGPNRDDVVGAAMLAVARGLKYGLTQEEILANVGKASRTELRRALRSAARDVDIAAIEYGHYADRPDPGEAVRAAIGQLPGHLRLMIEMHYWEGMTAAEIAELGGFPVRTVEDWLLKARRELKKFFGVSVVSPLRRCVVYRGGNTEPTCQDERPESLRAA